MLDMEQGQVQEGVVRTGELAGKKKHWASKLHNCVYVTHYNTGVLRRAHAQ